MAKLGTKERPNIVRVHADDTVEYVADTCSKNGWHYIVGFEPNKPEDISDLASSTSSLNNLVLSPLFSPSINALLIDSILAVVSCWFVTDIFCLLIPYIHVHL